MPPDACWRKSSLSGARHDCVEVTAAPGIVGVRDSKNRGDGPVLTFSAGAWDAFTGRLKAA
jgi:Domain of unknown function (DUF397)